MAKIRTVDLLPEIFQTDTNKKFLSATLDQLTQEPVLKKTQGYVGRRVGPGVNPNDYYVTESSAVRVDYQLEPGIVFFRPNTTTPEDAITYPGMIDALDVSGANTTRQDRLWQSEYYTWDPFCDLDKFSNYSQYYWLPQGPDPVDVATTAVPTTDSFEVTRVTNLVSGYEFTGYAGKNPVITLVRGGSYTFDVNQVGNDFWIQAAPGIDGTMPATPNISSRTVLGVINNGEDQGTVTFNVPLATAQDFYFGLTSIGTVDLLGGPTLKFTDLNNVYVSEFLDAFPTGVDGITNLDGRTIVFTNPTNDAQAGGWQITTQFDPLEQTPTNNGLAGSYDSLPFDQTTDIDTLAQRYSIWQINYVADDDGNFYMVLSSIQNVASLEKFTINFGTQWSSTGWYKDAFGYFQQIPLLTAPLNTLYYQDGTDPDIFGEIRLVNQSENNPIMIDDIIGAQNYTAPNGVVFTNGLKVQFRGLTEPAQFQDLEYYVEGVGTGLGLDERVGFIDGEAYFGPFHVYQGQKMTGSSHDETVFMQYIYDTVEESLANYGAGGPAGAPLPNTGVFGATTGNGIRLIPVSNFVTPETYTESESIPYDSTSYDVQPYDAALNAPLVPDYLTINRASSDLNAWTRSNRWFHQDVINYSAEINNVTPVLDNNARAKRPIIEFRADLRLFNFGTQGKQPVDIIDFNETDALSNINGQAGYGVDGYLFQAGTRVIFAADLDPEVRNRIYEVEFITPDDSSTQQIINLVEATNGEALLDQTVVCLSGVTLQGKSFWFDGDQWVTAQQKTGVNQAPLFDVYDANGVSYSNTAIYPSTTFAGSRLFGYALGGTSITDEILGFSLKFLNINNVGDIVFDNYLYNDTFLYVRDSVSYTQSVSEGFVRQYIDRGLFSNEIGWQTAAAENRSRQVFRFVYDGSDLVLDVPVDEDSIYPPLQVYQGTEFIDPTGYTYTVTATNTVITLVDPPVDGTVIEVQAISNVASAVGFYQVPLNLENNPLNENSTQFTLGTIRQHYESIGENLRNLVGPINGANNSRDLGDILRYGQNILQHSSPLALTGVFLRRQQYEVLNSIRFNSNEYEKYKALLLNQAAKGDYVNSTPTQVLDAVMLEISLGKSDISPFYWSDMVPSGENYTETTYAYTPISTNVFDTVQTYDFTSSNFLGLLVFLNGTLLTYGYDYTVGPDAPIVTITAALAVGDVIVIREYPTTYGSYVPNTPTKMGLYPAFKPEIFLDESYVTPTLVIRGHDGSITVAFEDYRDQVLLEFETRIYNNLKIRSEIPMDLADVMPGQFRTTDYTLAEINEILASDFLSWVGWNKLNYVDQTYLAADPFTYNYSQSSNRLNRQPLLGAWRGIYNYFYDTIAPNTRPWEMLGFSEEPTWWQDYYGPAPYTSGNLVLWEDLAAGLVKDPAGEYVLPQYIRPDLLDVIPAGSEGELLDPLQAVVGNFDATSFRRSWTFGADGPVESAWRTSSAWPFAVMRLLALTKPAKFFGLFADRDRYVYDENLQQYLWDQRYRLDGSQLSPIYGDGVSKASYINWIIDYNRQLGTNSTDDLTSALSNIGVRLCWRMGAFSDKKYLKIFTERSTPNSVNTSLLLPDESYSLLLYKDQPFDQIAYSSVIVQKVDGGYSVLGYSTTRPYFEIATSLVNGNTTTISAGDATVRLNLDHSDRVTQVPYGYVFTNATAVCDFLYSYGILLERQGFEFTSRENGYTLNWLQMAQEFLYWTNQGWGTGSLINLNPGATSIAVSRPQSVVDSLAQLRPENLILNQNRLPLPASELVIDRIENTFRVSSLTNNTISYLNLQFTSYEHIVILDNTSIFADLIYDPITGARQSRVRVAGWLSGDWTGRLDAPGFVLNQDNIQEWQANVKYAKGEIVLFKNEYWSASEIIQPAAAFEYAKWIKSDYDQIQKGLLPNSPNSSDQLATAYSVYDANLEQEVDLFSFGLIGFRPREYMAALNLDDVSQVGLYQQFLGTKGTTRSAELFTFANLGKEVAEYNIYEYWALLRAQYGATANRNYVELRLNEALLQSDPSLVQVIEPQQTSQADQTILLQNVWKSSTALQSPNFLPTTTSVPTDSALPTAGYVNFEDVDLSLFELTQATDQELSTLGIGDIVWVAKINNYDWAVYRIEGIPGYILQVSDNLDGNSLVQFSQQHGLAAGDTLIIRFFDDAINGSYIVKSVPSLTTAIIEYTFTGRQTIVTGEGVGLTLQSVRVPQAADVVDLPDANELTPGAKIWVDNNGSELWSVIEKTSPFDINVNLDPETPVVYSEYGTSLTQGFNNLSAMVGAPGYNPDNLGTAPGAVYTWVKGVNDAYVQNLIQTLDSTDAAGYGNAMDMGDATWAVVGAKASLNDWGYAAVIYNPPTSNAFTQSQLLVIPSGDEETSIDEFGYSVTISPNELWMYIGAPGGNRVYAYGRVDVQTQSVRYRADGSTAIYNYDQSIVIDDLVPSQLVVSVDSAIQTYGTDYIVSGGNVIFVTAPNAELLITIARRNSAIFESDGSTTTYDLSNIYTIDDIYSFSVYVNNVIQRPIFDYDLVGSDLEFVTAPGPLDTISVRAETYWTLVDTLTVAGLAADARFGHSVTTTADGRVVEVGAPGVSASEGRVYLFDRSVQRFQVTDAATLSYTLNSSPTAPVSVYVNGVIQVNTADNIGGTFTVSGSTVTFESDLLAVGDIIEIDINDFELIQTIESVDPFETAEFGYALDQCPTSCSLYIGAPFDGNNVVEAGRVEYWINQSRVYGTITSTVANPTLTAGNKIRINNYFVTLTGTTVASLAEDIIDAAIPNVTASASTSGYLTISVKNQDTAIALNKLQVMPGTGTAFADLGFDTYAHVQTIVSPVQQQFAHFGQSVFISNTALNLVIGAPNATAIEPTTFDGGTTYFDARTTDFFDAVANSGVVYTYDMLFAANASLSNPNQFVFGQQIYDEDLTSLDQFGTAINYTTGHLLIGAPGYDAGDSTLADFGRVAEFLNLDQGPAWATIRTQQPVVDIRLLNDVFMYDRVSSQAKQYFDFFDPLQGRILGAVRQNINFIGAVDPAAYNVGTVNNYGDRWAQDRVGQIWWNTSNVRFVDPNQDDIVYASRRWGQVFPGSTVDVYQWTANSVPPAEYSGPGQVRDTVSYCVTSSINEQGIFGTVYYYWVKDIVTVDRAAKKTLSVQTIARYIESPKSSGIAYIAPINSSTIAIYNGLPYISAEDTIIHVEYDEQLNDADVHVEYQLIPQDRADGFLNNSAYRKLQDSFCGVDTVGHLVPDPFLPESQKYGIEFRPRQSMFVNRFLALQNYLERANTVMAQFPISETRILNLLDSYEPEPTAGSGAWDKRVANIEELGYQNLAAVPYGYLYLVASDSTNDGLWTIYEVIAGTLVGSRELALVRVQSYDTRLYWSYIDWYRPGYNPLTRIAAEVPNYSSLATLTLAEGSSVKVTANGQGKWEIYLLEDGIWVRVGLEDGTIAINEEIWNYSLGRFGFDVEVFDAQYFDQEPVIETRKIIQALNEEIFIDDLAIERNRLMVLMFNYILTEQQAPEWLTKTSLIDVDHTIRELLPYQIYRTDNQDFVLNYIQEVKPYHTQIRQFNLIYTGSDTFDGTLTDFDCPAAWDPDENLFISPVLDNTGNLSTTSSRSSSDPIWQTFPWDQWYDNYTLQMQSVTVVDGGSGYTTAPTVVVTGTSTEAAVLTARINSAGQIVAIDIVSPGSGYVTTPVITFTGTGSGARAVAIMNNGLVRSFTTTIKYDRYQYSSTIVDWQAGVNYDNGTQVRYDDRVWEASSDDSTGVQSDTFDPQQWTLVAASTLSGVDRTMGFYAPTPDQPGLDLSLLITGVDYPGVQVQGPNFNQNTGFDVGNYDINPFDNISYGPEGLPTYDPAILDAIYESEYTDPYLGTLATSINVDGGAYVDTYSSHAPEELVPGAMFDTLDFRVYTTPGGDWTLDGHGFAIRSRRFEYTASGDEFSFADVQPYPVTLQVWNITTGDQLLLTHNYTQDWVAQTITVTSGANSGDVIEITVYELGGGNQLYRNFYNGADIGNTVTVPIKYSLIQEFAVFVNGSPVTDFTFAAQGSFSTRITFGSTYTASDYVSVTAIGPTIAADGVTELDYSWSVPVTQYIASAGELFYTLTNNVGGTNPANMIVEIDGVRARPPAGAAYIGDGSTERFDLPQNVGYDLGLVSDNQVGVWVDNVELTLGTQFIVNPVDSGQRSVTLTDVPDAGSKVLISVSFDADYTVSENYLTFSAISGFRPVSGDIVSVTTFNDTAQQDILTQVFVGPITTGVTIDEPYDSTNFDAGSVTGDPGSFDYSVGDLIQVNIFDTGRAITDPGRLTVSLNGKFIQYGDEWTVINGTSVEILGPILGPIDVVAITSFTQSVVPEAIAFRIFQDMRGTQLTYRITPDTTTELAQDLTATADVIHLVDASRVTEPNLEAGIFGQITINGERISYRTRNLVNNTVSGLRRGTSGTGAAAHAAGTPVYVIGLGNLLPPAYQDTTLVANSLADGSTTTFVASDISIGQLDSTEIVEAVQVYVGGILQTSGYTITDPGPVTVEFDDAPTAGYQVSIQVKQGLSWYQPGPGTASDGVPLQLTETQAARFIRGE